MADRLLGSFVWCELMTTDPAAAESFYKHVVQWTSVPFAPDGSYMVFQNAAGVGAAGLMALPAEARQMGAPPNWMVYVGTPTVDDTALRIAQLGGRVLKQPADIPGTGRFAVVQDPFGAVFGIYTPAMPGPGTSQPGIGDFSWFELMSPNPEGAWKFYETLFGWEKTSAMEMGEMGTYQMFGRGGGIPSGGIMKPPPGAPAAWMPYAMVKDAKAAATRATDQGAKIVLGPMEVPGGDWIAQGIDLQGAVFAVHSLSPAAQKTAPKKATPKKAPVKKAPVKKAPVKKAAPAKKAVSTRTAAPARKAAKKSIAKKSIAKKAKAKPVKKSAKPAKKKAAKKPVARKNPKKKAARRKK